LFLRRLLVIFLLFFSTPSFSPLFRVPPFFALYEPGDPAWFTFDIFWFFAGLIGPVFSSSWHSGYLHHVPSPPPLHARPLELSWNPPRPRLPIPPDVCLCGVVHPHFPSLWLAADPSPFLPDRSWGKALFPPPRPLVLESGTFLMIAPQLLTPDLFLFFPPGPFFFRPDPVQACFFSRCFPQSSWGVLDVSGKEINLNLFFSVFFPFFISLRVLFFFEWSECFPS